MVSSFFDGRVRLRADAFKSPQTLKTLETLIMAKDGVLCVTGNPRTGSLLVEYDVNRISRAELFETAKLLDARFGKSSEKKCSPLFAPLKRKDEVRILATACTLTLLGAFLSKRLHVAAGIAFALCAARHIHCRRKGIL